MRTVSKGAGIPEALCFVCLCLTGPSRDDYLVFSSSFFFRLVNVKPMDGDYCEAQA